jgi:hypothetical protein
MQDALWCKTLQDALFWNQANMHVHLGSERVKYFGIFGVSSRRFVKITGMTRIH